jgi:uncharacterized protein YkwD
MLRRLSALAIALTAVLAGLAPTTSSAAVPGTVRAKSCPGASLKPTSSNLPRVRAATLCLINGFRTTHGRRALKSNAALRRSARRHSADMARRNYFQHITPEGVGPRTRAARSGYRRHAASVGENIAWGGGPLSTPRQIVRSWIRSPGHRANLLLRRYRAIGVGVAMGTPAGGFPGATYTTDFGAR